MPHELFHILHTKRSILRMRSPLPRAALDGDVCDRAPKNLTPQRPPVYHRGNDDSIQPEVALRTSAGNPVFCTRVPDVSTVDRTKLQSGLLEEQSFHDLATITATGSSCILRGSSGAAFREGLTNVSADAVLASESASGRYEAVSRISRAICESCEPEELVKSLAKNVLYLFRGGVSGVPGQRRRTEPVGDLEPGLLGQISPAN